MSDVQSVYNPQIQDWKWEDKIQAGKTDGILHCCESHAQGAQGSTRASFDQTTCCIVQSEEVGKTPGYGVLGRKTARSKERIEVLLNKM